MSTYGMTVTVLATQLAEAVLKDEAPEEGGFDLSAGMFGKHVSDWIRATAAELDARTARARAWKECAEHNYGLFRAANNPDEVDYPTAGALDAWAAGRHPVLAPNMELTGGALTHDTERPA